MPELVAGTLDRVPVLVGEPDPLEPFQQLVGEPGAGGVLAAVQVRLAGREQPRAVRCWPRTGWPPPPGDLAGEGLADREERGGGSSSGCRTAGPAPIRGGGRRAGSCRPESSRARMAGDSSAGCSESAGTSRSRIRAPGLRSSGLARPPASARRPQSGGQRIFRAGSRPLLPYRVRYSAQPGRDRKPSLTPAHRHGATGLQHSPQITRRQLSLSFSLASRVSGRTWHVEPLPGGRAEPTSAWAFFKDPHGALIRRPTAPYLYPPGTARRFWACADSASVSLDSCRFLRAAGRVQGRAAPA